MAGIKEAMKRVMDHRNKGRVIAMGKTKDCSCGDNEACGDCSNVSYIVIRLNGHSKKDANYCGGLITIYDRGSDVRIADDIDILDDVILMIHSNWSATWEKIRHKKHRVGYIADRAEELTNNND